MFPKRGKGDRMGLLPEMTPWDPTQGKAMSPNLCDHLESPQAELSACMPSL